MEDYVNRRGGRKRKKKANKKKTEELKLLRRSLFICVQRGVNDVYFMCVNFFLIKKLAGS